METHRVDTKMKFDSDFLKDRYDYELKRKEQITAALTLQVGSLIAFAIAPAYSAGTTAPRGIVLSARLRWSNT